jgi:hypothetical protein
VRFPALFLHQVPAVCKPILVVFVPSGFDELGEFAICYRNGVNPVGVQEDLVLRQLVVVAKSVAGEPKLVEPAGNFDRAGRIFSSDGKIAINIDRSVVVGRVRKPLEIMLKVVEHELLMLHFMLHSKCDIVTKVSCHRLLAK